MRKAFILLLFTCSAASWSNISANEWSGDVSFQSRHFSQDALYPLQFNEYGSVALKAEWFHEWAGGKQSLVFVPFTRWDQHDEERTHSDIRELSWLKVFDASELRVGVRKVFWGVSESQHLVDVINQTDLVESSDGEQKLGQPMINYALIQDWGTVDLFVLPYFRERTFPGVNGRLRTALPVDTTNPIYESSDKENHIDYAARWSHSVGDWDIGLSHFNGTSRNPSFVLGSGNTVIPFYSLMQQTGLDIQATKEAWLWKVEVINRKTKEIDFITRKTQTEKYIAATAGFEYTFNGVFESAADIGLVMEYLYDERKSQATTPFEDDLMLGVRWTNNDEHDTSVLVGVIADQNDSSRLYSIEASRRLGESMKLNLEVRVFEGITDMNSPLYSLRDDDFAQIELAYYF